MKKTTTHLSAIAGIFSLIFLLSNNATAQDIKLTRFIDPPVVTPGSTVTINVFLDKGYRGGIARLDEFIPSGFTATEGDDNGSKFSVNDSILKFSWEDMPSDPGFTLSYHLHVPASALGTYTLVAQFVYLTSNGAAASYFKPYTFIVQLPGTNTPSTTTVSAAPAKDTVKMPAAVALNTVPKVAPVIKLDTTTEKPVIVATAPPVVKSVPAPAPPKTPAPVANKSPAPAPTANTKVNIQHPTVVAPRVTALPKTKPTPVTIADTAKANGLWYRVQIMASSERLNVDSVIINGIRDRLYIITTHGISRYYIGAFHNLQPAVEYRNRIVGNGLKGPFVVAYKNGQKITIREALQVVATN